MKRLILPIVIALLAGLGGGSGYAYMTSAPIVPDTTVHADSAGAHAADSTKHGTSHDSAAANESAIADTLQHADSLSHAADSVSRAAAVPMTPADSIRAAQGARAALHQESATAIKGAPSVVLPTPGIAVPAAKTGTKATAAGAEPKGTHDAADAVRAARNDALQTALPEQRLAKIFGAMQAKDAGKVLEQMTDGDIRTILGMMSDRQAAAIIATLPAQRAATITKGAVSRTPGSTP